MNGQEQERKQIKFEFVCEHDLNKTSRNFAIKKKIIGTVVMSPQTTNQVHQIASSEFDSFKCFQCIYKLRLLQTTTNAHSPSFIK